MFFDSAIKAGTENGAKGFAPSFIGETLIMEVLRENSFHMVDFVMNLPLANVSTGDLFWKKRLAKGEGEEGEDRTSKKAKTIEEGLLIWYGVCKGHSRAY